MTTFYESINIIMSTNPTFWNNIKNKYREKRLLKTIYLKIEPILQGMPYALYDPASTRISLYLPDYVQPSRDNGELKIVERIFNAYKKMKADQRKAPAYYLPSSLWQANLDKSYSFINSGNIEKFHFFLANFGTWETDTGITAGTLMRSNMKSFIRRRYLKNVVFNKKLNYWQGFYNNRKSIACLSYPTHGNQAGAYVNNLFIGSGSFFNEIYGSLLSEIISDSKHPVVAELGAGYGKLAYFTLRNIESFTFIDFDLPEILCLAAYFLMKTWPDKKVLLYGEDDYSTSTHAKYDLIFMPSYEICNTGQSTVDLFINKNSLGEMTQEAVQRYIDYIAKAAKYFFHINHELYPNYYADNEQGLLGYEYPVPSDKFKLIFRYPEINSMLSKSSLIDLYIYLYQRTNM